jgi:hypothetical protein
MLNTQFKLCKEDFLVHDLFLASQSSFGKKSRKRLRYFLFIFLSLFAGLMFYWSLFFQGIFYLLFAVGCFVFFPMFQYKRHRRYFSNFVEDKYSELFGEVVEMGLDEAYIYIKALSSESKIAFHDITEIMEIESYFMIRLKLGRTILMPKKQLENFEEIKAFVLLQTNKLGVPFKEDLDWKWE